MKLTNREVRFRIINYNKVADEHVEMKCSTLYKFHRNIEKLNEVNEVINKTIREIEEKYNYDPESQEIQKEFNELNDVENEVDIQMIPLSEFDGVTCSQQFMSAIFFMIDEDK